MQSGDPIRITAVGATLIVDDRNLVGPNP